MCGIAGIFNRKPEHGDELLKKMIKKLSHRGPDGYGLYTDNTTGLAHARLSIIDLEGGWQPISNENDKIWIVFNGEIFNYIELRRDLIQKGHIFRTNSDTEVIVHLYEEEGVDMVHHLNGQFAIAIHDTLNDVAYLIRDRIGIHPLYYALKNRTLHFASEIKALFVNPELRSSINTNALSEIFTYWTTIAPTTIFDGIEQVPEGCYLKFQNGTISSHKYWDHTYNTNYDRSYHDTVKEFHELLLDAIRIRLRSDVPVGAYLSGGIDSSTIAAYIHNFTDNDLRTFSVTFGESQFDESFYQQNLIDKYHIDHTFFDCREEDIRSNFQKLIWHTETPIIRTAATPLMILSEHVRKHNYKVVLTGEGADEALAGYDIFREDKVRRMIKEEPERANELLSQLYPWKENIASNTVFLNAFLGEYNADLPYSSHIPRWNTTSRIKHFMLADHPNQYLIDRNLYDIKKPLHRAQYIEYHTLLAGYLLASQGDRVLMANSVEGRYPFLDHRLIEFCNTLPDAMKLNDRNKIMREKDILYTTTESIVPDIIRHRRKKPYMAPDAACFVNDDNTKRLLSEAITKEYGYFNAKKVALLFKKGEAGKITGFSDNMAFIGILSTHILHELFLKHYGSYHESVDNLHVNKKGD